MKSRRHILTFAVLTATGAALYPLTKASRQVVPTELSGLHQRLHAFLDWVRAETGADGVPELHCGVTDLSGLSLHVPKLPDDRGRVRARGNALAFLAAGKPVRVILHHVSAAV